MWLREGVMGDNRAASILKRKPAYSFCSQSSRDEREEVGVKGRIVKQLQ